MGFVQLLKQKAQKLLVTLNILRLFGSVIHKLKLTKVVKTVHLQLTQMRKIAMTNVAHVLQETQIIVMNVAIADLTPLHVAANLVLMRQLTEIVWNVHLRVTLAVVLKIRVQNVNIIE